MHTLFEQMASDQLSAECEAIWETTIAQERDEWRARNANPILRLWDGEWKLHHLITNEFKGSFEWVDNDTGTGMLELPAECEAAQWLYDMKKRIDSGDKRNVHVTVDYVGARWGGRLEDFSIEETEDGDQIATVTFLHDYENLKWYQVWSNPFLPAAIQFPRVWIMPGPARWSLLTCLFVNLLRDQASLWTLPDDPMNGDKWFDLDQSNWSIVCKPLSFLQDMAAGTMWACPVSRWKTWHDIAKPILQDGELSVRCERYLAGDPPPWPGANLRPGTLVVDIVDKSGTYTGTAHGGSIFDGLVRTVQQVLSDGIDSTFSAFGDTGIPSDYYVPGQKNTNKKLPYVVVRPGITPGVESAKFTQTPSKAVQVNTGGHSMPGVNEAISAGIQALGDVLGNLVQIGSIGGSVDTLLKPFYEDTILAWMSVKSLQRSSTAGWSRYFEYFQDGADKAYTLSSLMVLRAGFWATRTWFSHEIHLLDSLPYMLGDRGQGHMWLSDRIGCTVPGDPLGTIHLDRISKVALSWDEAQFAPDWTITIGDDKKNVDPLVAVMERIESITGGLQDLGVF